MSDTTPPEPTLDIPDKLVDQYMHQKFDKGSLGRPPKGVADKIKIIKRNKLSKNRKNQLIERSAFDLFMEEYERNGGNGTEAALATLNTTNRASASTLAARYLKQAQDIGRMIMEKKGITYEKLIELAWQKAQESKGTEFWDRLMKLIGEDFMSKQTAATSVNVNINQTQKEVRDEFGFGEAVDGEIDDGKTI